MPEDDLAASDGLCCHSLVLPNGSVVDAAELDSSPGDLSGIV